MCCKLGTRLVIALLATVDFCIGQGRAKSFSVSVQGQPANITRKDNDVMLLCETGGIPSSIQITRLRDGYIVKVTWGRQQSLEYLIQSVTCEDMGTYLCVFGNETQTTDVVVSDCSPQPCHVDDVNRTIYVDVNQSVQFSLCVLAYPGISEFVDINNITLRKKATSNWTWDYHQLRTTSNLLVRANLTFSRDQMAEDEYGLLNIRVFSSTGTKAYLAYKMLLQSPGPPECPTDIDGTGEGMNHIELSWQPGLDRGLKQSFHVYFSKDKVTWYRYDVNGSSTANITGLEEDTIYYFRVVSSNAVRMSVDETVCDNTNSHKTGKGPSAIGDNSAKETLYITVIICLSIVLAVLLTFILYQQRVKKQSQMAHGEDEIQQNEKCQDLKLPGNDSMDPGHYISDEGLTYISVSQLTDKLKKIKAQKKVQRKVEKVEYASLNFIKSGQVQLQQDAPRTTRHKHRDHRVH